MQQSSQTDHVFIHNSVDAIQQAISSRLLYAVGKDRRSANQRDWMFAVFHTVRDLVMNRWRESLQESQNQDAKRVYYLSMEFLAGRALVNALLAADVYDKVKEACTRLGTDFDALIDVEPDAALGRLDVAELLRDDPT